MGAFLVCENCTVDNGVMFPGHVGSREHDYGWGYFLLVILHSVPIQSIFYLTDSYY